MRWFRRSKKVVDWHQHLVPGGMPAPNEVWISIGVLEQMLAKGHETNCFIRVVDGPDPRAKILSAYWLHGTLVLVYDRPVPEPQLQSFHG